MILIKKKNGKIKTKTQNNGNEVKNKITVGLSVFNKKSKIFSITYYSGTYCL